MTTSSAIRDSRTMIRRNLLHARRYPALTFSAVLMPVLFLLLFVYVFGGTLGAGLSGGTGDRSAYLAYVTPGILVLAVSSGCISPSVAVNTDLTEGIVARFRTMAISRNALLVGHVVSSVLLTMLGAITVLAVAVAIGFRPTAGILGWLALVGLATMIALALTWLSVGIGVSSRSPETASNAVLPLMFLPFLGSAFVPTDSMPAGLQWFAAHQPFTSMIEAFRGLLSGQGAGSAGLVALIWCAALTAVGWWWARSAFRRAAVR